jgi:hypothetical protein
MNYFINFCFWYVLLCFFCDTVLVALEASEVSNFENDPDLKSEPYSFKNMIEMHFISHILFLLSPFFLIAELVYILYEYVQDMFKK